MVCPDLGEDAAARFDVGWRIVRSAWSDSYFAILGGCDVREKHVSGGRSEDRRSGAMRLLALLAAFEQADGPLGFGELARAAELAPSTARRLLGELLDWGGVERTTFGQYRLGPRLRRLGAPSASAPGANRDEMRAYLTVPGPFVLATTPLAARGRPG